MAMVRMMRRMMMMTIRSRRKLNMKICKGYDDDVE